MTDDPDGTGTPVHTDLEARFGRRVGNVAVRKRPPGMSDDTVSALGKLSAALETAEDARGHLYSFHRLCGSADLALQDAVAALRAAGHGRLADTIATVMVGRDVVGDRWSFEIVEDYDANYLEAFRAAEQTAREALNAPRHLAEAEMKVREQDGLTGDAQDDHG